MFRRLASRHEGRILTCKQYTDKTGVIILQLAESIHRRLIILSIVGVLCCAPVRVPASGGTPHVFDKLLARLASDGFDGQLLQRYYSATDVAFESDAMALFFRHRESRLNYDQFLAESAMRSAGNYMEKHADALSRAEASFNVDKEIITAVILVETRLGTFLGNRSTLNILSSMASLADPVKRDMFWRTIHKKTSMSRKDYQVKAKRKSKWAYGELKAFLTYVEREKIANPSAINGSYSGAMGIAQFMPSNILTLGIDGDNDGTVNLFTHADAIHSIANYLQHYGWRLGISEEKARKVLLRYNHSRYYVDTLMKIFKKLKGRT